MRLDPLSIIRLLRGTRTQPRQTADQILFAQIERDVRMIFGDRSNASTADPEPEVCDLCGKPPGPGHESCNRAIEAGLD